MKTKTGISALTMALALAACGSENANNTTAAAPAASVAPPAGTTWVETVTKTADGGFLMGNPNATVKLVEYGSLTCSHCAVFAETGLSALKEKYISRGTVSLEFRNFVRDPIDMTAALLSRCNGAGPFYQLTDQIFAEQEQLLSRFQSLGEAGFQRIQSLPPEQMFGEFAKAGGLDQFVQQRGVSSEKAATCLSNKAAVDELVGMQKRAVDDFNVNATPTFLINGQVATNAADWTNLEPQIRAAGG